MITVNVDLKQKHRISPYLYMQFMEPLGTADSSVDAAWDFVKKDWHPLVMEQVRKLAPTMVRFGGTMIDYYRWQEGVGPNRIPMINHCWGGIYHNQVGTHEFVDFCRRIQAEPLMVVNMESDGFQNWAYPQPGVCRKGTAREAADWVRYCNDPEHPLRLQHGISAPCNIRYWQLGNETSYRIREQLGFDVDGCYDATSRFAEAMRKADPKLTLIGWGDYDHEKKNWMQTMSRLDGIDLLAFHHHFGSGLPDSPLRGTQYRDNWENTWLHLMNAHKSLDEHIRVLRADCGNKRLAMTEGHYGLPGRNRNEVLSSWGAGVSYARCLNVIMRHSDVLDIATMADFFGNVWQVNALMIPSPVPYYGKPYLQPVGAVMALFGKYQGTHALDCTYSGSIDAVASRTGNKIYLHVANTDMYAAQELRLNVGQKAQLHLIHADLATEITQSNPDVFEPETRIIDPACFTLPAAAVAAIEIEV